MERIDLPHELHLQERHLLDWTPAPVIQPNPELLKALTSSRRSVRTGKAQSEISKQRQNFITGMGRYRMSNEEREARKAYEDEWGARVGNDSV